MASKKERTSGGAVPAPPPPPPHPVGVSVTGKPPEDGPTVMVFPVTNAMRHTDNRLDVDGTFPKTRNIHGAKVLARPIINGEGGLAVDVVTGCVFIGDQLSTRSHPFIRVFNKDKIYQGIIPCEAFDKGLTRGNSRQTLRISFLHVDPYRRILYVGTMGINAHNFAPDSLIAVPLHDPYSSYLVTGYGENSAAIKDPEFHDMDVHVQTGDLFLCLAFAVRMYAGNSLQIRRLRNEVDQPMEFTERIRRNPASGELQDACPFATTGDSKKTGTYGRLILDQNKNQVYTLVTRYGQVAVICYPIRAEIGTEGGAGAASSSSSSSSSTTTTSTSTTTSTKKNLITTGPPQLSAFFKGHILAWETAILANLPVRLPGAPSSSHITGLTPCLLARKNEFADVPDEDTGELHRTIVGIEDDTTIFALQSIPADGKITKVSHPDFPHLPVVGVIPARLIKPIHTISRIIVNPLSKDCFIFDQHTRSNFSPIICRPFHELLPQDTDVDPLQFTTYVKSLGNYNHSNGGGDSIRTVVGSLSRFGGGGLATGVTTMGAGSGGSGGSSTMASSSTSSTPLASSSPTPKFVFGKAETKKK